MIGTQEAITVGRRTWTELSWPCAQVECVYLKWCWERRTKDESTEHEEGRGQAILRLDRGKCGTRLVLKSECAERVFEDDGTVMAPNLGCRLRWTTIATRHVK